MDIQLLPLLKRLSFLHWIFFAVLSKISWNYICGHKSGFSILLHWALCLFLHQYHTSAAAAAKSRQSCPTLCDPIDGSPLGSPVPGILQARTLEWVAISFSNAWKWKNKVKSLSHVRLLATPWTATWPSTHGIFQAGVLEWGAIAFSDTIHQDCDNTDIRFFCYSSADHGGELIFLVSFLIFCSHWEISIVLFSSSLKLLSFCTILLLSQFISFF